MKKYFLLAFTFAILCGQFPSYGQSDNLQKNSKLKTDFPLELSVVKNSSDVHTSDVHTYLLQVANNFDKPLTAKIITGNVTCNENTRVSVPFLQNVYLNESDATLPRSNNTTTVTIEARSVLTFYVTLTRSAGAILNSWNCTTVKAVGSDGSSISNSIQLETFIPDPTDFR